ncbi:ribonuclease HII [Gracilibacillus kekensis]|uniref:Ribonuclease HII n=1 Tax=Gracilibacillus kekensis TaxID=1027249 RepID=A0A1M7PG14_9BACI|nr:ribonuclease HII [Gracilibacillus kekensis]SHN15983.1 RNase HII [Gracilibacillus kekensis]
MTDKWTINQIKDYLFSDEKPSEDLLKKLYCDQRIGVKKMLNQYENRLAAKQAEEDHFLKISRFEQELWKNGLTHIAGVDEVGRGPLAGPVVAAAVILPSDFKLLGINDSKKLSKKKRELYYHYITTHATDYSVGVVDAAEIDRINILQASKKAMYHAINGLMKIDYVLIDAVKLEKLSVPSNAIIKGDQKSMSIAAASIVAKVTRDKMMENIHEKYPSYDFHKNSGYGTKVHLKAIEENGLTRYHRRSFLKSLQLGGN